MNEKPKSRKNKELKVVIVNYLTEEEKQEKIKQIEKIIEQKFYK